MAKFFNSAASMISLALSKNVDPNQVSQVVVVLNLGDEWW